MKRILAHTIIYKDIEYPMSVATIEGNKVVKIEPFVREIHSTSFISGKILLVPTDISVDIIRL